MSDSIQTQGKTVNDAVSEALLQLGLRRDEVEIKVLEEPKAGLLGDFYKRVAVDRANSIVVGDRQTDVKFGANIGVPAVRIDQDNPLAWSGIIRELVDRPRVAQVTRETKETRIRVDVDLDAEGPIEVSTGIGFFDHMLEQVAKHGGFSLKLDCDGDLEVDEHHTIEDTALALGQAVREALGDKRGIARFGFLLPMDETRAQVALDMSGRPYSVFEGEFGRSEVGGLPTEMVPHFFRSLAESLGAALHVTVQGDNTHHMVESCFKATGRALRQAIRLEGEQLPSTKGTL